MDQAQFNGFGVDYESGSKPFDLLVSTIMYTLFSF
jgi:hypothetical protein